MPDPLVSLHFTNQEEKGEESKWSCTEEVFKGLIHTLASITNSFQPQTEVQQII